MKRILILIVCLFIISNLTWAKRVGDNEKNWPQWRGPYATGVSLYGNPPLEWDETKNVKWKIGLPGKGHATPIIWGNQIFISTAIETDKVAKQKGKKEGEERTHSWMQPTITDKIHKFVILSVDRRNGKILWQRTVREEWPEEGRSHGLGSWASNSPVTDGRHVYAYFGSRGLYCLDMQGNLKWERDFGQMDKRMTFGEGSSPALYEDRILVLWDHEGQSFLFTLDKKTGKDVWKVERDEISSWSTPLIVEHKGKTQVITSAAKFVRSYDLATGGLIWQCTGLTQNVIPHPVEANGIVYVASGFRGNALFAVRLSGAKGDITDTDAIAWKLDKNTPYAPSPVLYQNKLYLLKSNNGILSCYDAGDGKEYYSNQRFEGMGNIYASPVGAKDRIYFIGHKGDMYVIKHGSEFKVLAKNELDDNFIASPAIVGNEIYLRGYKNLYCIAHK
ncbi:MAG: PQQ-binding-like beta-propeller repeat protein [Candidatus Aminicenantes bacterium]|nr:PQQ-binding-like beta-propeller repeat protein [Candidatus Aminicenantes bacterium]NIM84872.1 PQQ-binding-like beta-propeller repeat protein [Candidatus Aminicenantes bacterium]NIN24380.1 PQQ-binding-like beta-propeller repeat protein [Candidatus Aminicenantes bacterium]NIN48144.1 PQQ-binding-like beta-propeller repeat protein [Candidatus Aminicenantes bacterium]NIN91047.1 PQQ-binding-like beta-propeller repeat protein [Candidatus Aminicenantes bacterium]